MSDGTSIADVVSEQLFNTNYLQLVKIGRIDKPPASLKF